MNNEKNINVNGNPVVHNPIEYQKPGKEPELKKLYLVLWVGEYESAGTNFNHFEFYYGTKQEVYDTIVNYILGMDSETKATSESNDKVIINLAKSLIIIDSDGVKISDYISIYKYISLQMERGIINPNPEFDLSIYEAEVDMNAEEEGQVYSNE